MLDIVLMVCLILILPAWQVRRSLRKSPSAITSRGTRYWQAILRISLLLLLLAVDWWSSARPLSLLGFDMPLSARGQLGLGIAAVLIIGLLVGDLISSRRQKDEKRAAHRARFESSDFLPRNSAEFRGFSVLAIMIGAGWEILYRGFLLFSLTPLVGTIGAVCIAALAYGLAHGFQSRGQFFGSIISAFLFTIAYALTLSLWWLMLLHAFMALFGGWTSYRLLRGNAS